MKRPFADCTSTQPFAETLPSTPAVRKAESSPGIRLSDRDGRMFARRTVLVLTAISWLLASCVSGDAPAGPHEIAVYERRVSDNQARVLVRCSATTLATEDRFSRQRVALRLRSVGRQSGQRIEYHGVVRNHRGSVIAEIRCRVPATVSALVALEQMLTRSQISPARREELASMVKGSASEAPPEFLSCTPGAVCLSPGVVTASWSPPVVVQWSGWGNWLGYRDASIVDWGGGGWTGSTPEEPPAETCQPGDPTCIKPLQKGDSAVIEEAFGRLKPRASFTSAAVFDVCQQLLGRIREAYQRGWVFRGTVDSPNHNHNGGSIQRADGTWEIHIDRRILDGAGKPVDDPEQWVGGKDPESWRNILTGTLLHEAAHSLGFPNHGETERSGEYTTFPYNHTSGGTDQSGRAAETCGR